MILEWYAKRFIYLEFCLDNFFLGVIMPLQHPT